jgi:multiple sugar transport system substrate-binding protein
MLYVNMDMVRKAGFNAPPETWDDFLEQCRAIKKTLGIKPYALSIDASTVDATVFSFGGEVYDAEKKQTVFNSSAGLAAFRLLETLAKEELAHRIDFDSQNDRIRFARGEAAFFIRSSAGRPQASKLVGKSFDWDLAMLPHGKGTKPATVLFGSNVCLFASSPERERETWELTKFLTSTDVTARWAILTGYLPVRKSALQTPVLQKYLAENKQSRAPIEALGVARFEPSVSSWQEMRTMIEKAEADVFDGRVTAEEAVRSLDESSKNLMGK